MSQFFQIHPDNPQTRLLQQTQHILESGGIIAYPTDSGYALGCLIGNHAAQQRIRQIRQVDDQHFFSLICRNLSEIGNYAVLNNSQFRLLKANTPGAYTFVLKATREVPKKLQHPKRSTIGFRVPDHQVTQALLDELDAPLLSMSLNPETLALMDADSIACEGWEVREALEHDVDLVMDVGNCPFLATSVIDLTEATPSLIRAGEGDLAPFGLD